jgi:hypothetical protein
MPAGVPSTQFPKEERHDIRETFADSLSQCLFDGQTLRLELCSIRLDEAKPPPAKPTGKRHVVARIVLTPEGDCSTPAFKWRAHSSKPEF